MPSSGMLCRVALVRTDVSLYFFVGCQLLVTGNAVPSSPILVTLEALSSSEISVITRAKRRNIPHDDVLHSHRRDNLKSYNHKTCFGV
jgi:hypothetical protein